MYVFLIEVSIRLFLKYVAIIKPILIFLFQNLNTPKTKPTLNLILLIPVKRHIKQII